MLGLRVNFLLHLYQIQQNILVLRFVDVFELVLINAALLDDAIINFVQDLLVDFRFAEFLEVFQLKDVFVHNERVSELHQVINPDGFDVLYDLGIEIGHHLVIRGLFLEKLDRNLLVVNYELTPLSVELSFLNSITRIQSGVEMQRVARTE